MRVVIADDSALLREGLSRLLTESGVDVCATVADASGLAEAVTDASPRCRHRRHPDAADVHPRGCRRRGRAAVDAIRILGILLLSQAIETHFAAQLLERHAGALRLPAQGPGRRRVGPDAGAATPSRPAAPCSIPTSSEA